MATFISITDRMAKEWIVVRTAIRLRAKEERDASDLWADLARLESDIIALAAPIDRAQARSLSDTRRADNNLNRYFFRRGRM